MLRLITHAYTRQVPNTDASGWQLAEIGQQQALALARQPFWQGVDRVLLSREPKTGLTVEPLLHSRPLPVHTDARFDELRRPPQWTEDYAGRVAAVFAQPDASIGGWEPAAQALARFRQAVEEWTGRHPEESLALVGHGLTFSLYRAHLLGQARVRLEDWQALPFAAVAAVEDGALVEDFAVPAGVPRMERGG